MSAMAGYAETLLYTPSARVDGQKEKLTVELSRVLPNCHRTGLPTRDRDR